MHRVRAEIQERRDWTGNESNSDINRPNDPRANDP